MLRSCCSIALALALCSAGLNAGELDSLRESVRTESSSSDNSTATPEKKKKEKPRRSWSVSTPHDDCDDDSNVFGELLGTMFLIAVTTPWTIPIAITADEYAEPFAIVPRPYHDAPYAMIRETPEDDLPPVFGRLQLDFGDDFNDLSRSGVQLLVETPSRWGVDVGWTAWREESATRVDRLNLGDANLVFRFAQNEDLQFRTGIGVNWLDDRAGSELGFNFTHGFDYYPKRPWVISSTFDIGTLGHAGLFHNQTTVGCQVGRCEIFVGHDYYRIGRADLSNWISGLRFRF